MSDEQGFQDLSLTHKASIREHISPPLAVVAKETEFLERGKDGENRTTLNEYTVMGELGQGAFSRVFQVITNDNHRYALKQFSVKKLAKHRFWAPDMQFTDGLQALTNQLNIAKRLNHPNISRCIEIISSCDYIYGVWEIGDLGAVMQFKENTFKRNPKVMDLLSAKYGSSDLAKLTGVLFVQVCCAVDYLHRHNITHRDIKPQNIVGRRGEPPFQIIDFTTVRFSEDDVSYNTTGTPGFRPPDMLEEGYSCKAADVWSVGISIYIFFTEFFPFWGNTDLQIDIYARDKPLHYGEEWPTPLKTIVELMTQKNPKNRCTIQQALNMLESFVTP